MVDRAPSLHDFDDCRFDLIDPEVIDFFLDAGAFLVLGLLAYHDWDLVAEQRTLVIDINGQDVLWREGMGGWVLQQELAFYQRDQMLLQVLDWNLRNLKHTLVTNLGVLIKQHQQKHLVTRCQELIPLAEVASQLRRPQAKFPVDLSPVIELREVELRERRHCICNLFWQRYQLGNWLLPVLRPVPLRKYLHVEL